MEAKRLGALVRELVPNARYRKDVALDGTTPCLLYSYGAYGLSIPAAFSSTPTRQR
jgi:oligopeptidase B